MKSLFRSVQRLFRHRKVASYGEGCRQRMTGLGLELLEDRTLLSPFTIITHGYQLDSRDPPGWAHAMRAALQDRSNGVAGNEVVVDWAAESRSWMRGWAEATGDELFARIMWEAQRRDAPFDLHYIGHSRGTVVNSEANERLAYYETVLPPVDHAIDRVQFTMLDAHPANNTVGASGLFVLTFIQQLFEKHVQDPNPEIWHNVEWADAYFQRTNTLLGLNPHGLDFRPSVFSQDFTGEFHHTDFGNWYANTIANKMSSQGYYYSLAGDGWEERPEPRDITGQTPSGPPRLS
jgi:hypothetical protein